MRRRLIVHLGCRRGGANVTAACFHRLGMSLGPFPLVGASNSDPLGRCEALPIADLDRRLHKAIYGFPEEGVDPRLAGHILFNRSKLLPDLRQLPNEWIREGVHRIQTLVQSAEISGFHQPTAALFWDYWNHVLSHFPEVSVHLVFTVRAPRAIASTYVQNGSPVQRVEDVLDLLAAHHSRLAHVRKTWGGPSAVVRFSQEHYGADLRSAVTACGLRWDEAAISECFDPARIEGAAPKVNHPVEQMYEQILSPS